MPTQGERQQFLWRPNDNSSTTITRYDQEAEHWVKAIRGAKAKRGINEPADISGVFNAFGLILGLIISLLTLIYYGLVSIVKGINHIGHNHRIRKRHEDELNWIKSQPNKIYPTDDELNSRFVNNPNVNIKDFSN